MKKWPINKKWIRDVMKDQPLEMVDEEMAKVVKYGEQIPADVLIPEVQWVPISHLLPEGKRSSATKRSVSQHGPMVPGSPSLQWHDHVSEGRRGGSPTLLKHEAKIVKVPVERLLIDVFRHRVGRVILAEHLKELEILTPDLILDP